MIRVYHHPRCSKSRAVLDLLEQRGGAQVEVINYLDAAPDRAELVGLLQQLGIGARQLLRVDEPDYRRLGLADPALDDAALIGAMATHPALIQRPIVVADGKAVIGRTPEAVLASL